MSSNRRILVLALSGIGNFIMQSPVIAAIKHAHPDWHITCWVAPRGTKELALNDPNIDEVIELPIKNSLAGHWRTIKLLRQQKFNTALVSSPGQQIKSAALLYLAGIPQRLGHQYPTFNSPHSQLFLTNSIPEADNLHDLEQNLNLLSLLDISPDADSTGRPYSLTIPAEGEQAAAWIISGLDIPDSAPLVGIHPGAAAGFAWKRWPIDNFVDVAKHLISQHQAHILIFGGPAETALKHQVQHRIGLNHSSVVTSNLLTAAALMQRCLVVISNDSGLMHLAAASGVTTLGIFGPTDEHLTGPRGSDSHTIRAHDTQPVYHTEANQDLGTQPHSSLVALDAQSVINQLSNII